MLLFHKQRMIMNIFVVASVLFLINQNCFGLVSAAETHDPSVYPDVRNAQHILNVMESVPKKRWTDKLIDHKYNVMYGLFLLPLKESAKKTKTKIKFLEIGLGCFGEKNEVAGASSLLWNKLFPLENTDRWIAEFVKECYDRHKDRLKKRDHTNLMQGSQ